MITLKSSLHLITLLTSFLAYVIIVTTKGFFSAWVTKQMGDPTAQQEGYLSWNPLVHIDIIGAISDILTADGGLAFTKGTNLFNGPLRPVSNNIPAQSLFLDTFDGPEPVRVMGQATEIRMGIVEIRYRS